MYSGFWVVSGGSHFLALHSECGWPQGKSRAHLPLPRGNLGKRLQGREVPHSPLRPRNHHCHTGASAAEGRGSPGAAPPPNAFANRPAACPPREVSRLGPFLAHARTRPDRSLPLPPSSPGAVPFRHLARMHLPARTEPSTGGSPDPEGPTSGPFACSQALHL